MFRTSASTFCLALLLAAPAAAATGEYDRARAHVEQLVRNLVAEVTENRAAYEDDEPRLFALIDERIIPSVDIELLGRITLGKRQWAAASEEQRKLFVLHLRQLLTRSYGKSLTLLAEVDEVLFPPPGKPAKNKKVQGVVSRMEFKGGQTPLAVKYMVHFDGKGWRIFDLVIDGVSIAGQFKNNFKREIAETSLDALIARLGGVSR